MENINEDKDTMDCLIESAVLFAKQVDVNADDYFSRHHRRRIKPKRLDSSADTETEFSLKNYYRKEFSEVLDTLITLAKENLKKKLRLCHSAL